MFPAIGAASAAIDALKSLTSSKSTTKTGFAQAASNPFDQSDSTAQASSMGTATGGSGFTQISPQTMSALLDAQSQSATGSTTSTTTSRSSALKDLFSKIDGDGDGKITQSEFENALGAGGTNVKAADNVFSKLDQNGDGSVSLDEMSSALKGAGGKGGHHHHRSAGGSGNADGSNTDPLLAALQGASSTSTTNSDGTTTTSLTYADGSKVTMTSAASGSASSAATSSYNFLEQMIQRDAKALASSATSSLSVSV
ncbi:MAG: EF-hand domain-containing protein [Bradyrhizobium sp.]